LRAAGAALATYARLLVAPTGLHLDRLAPVGGAADTWLGGAGAGAIVIALVAFVLRPSRMSFGIAALALLAVPASNLLPVYPAIADRWVFAGEQLAYMPIAVIGPLAACALAALSDVVAGSSLVRDAVVLAAAVVAVALSVAPVSARQAELADAEALYRNTLAHSPSPRACFNLGVTLLGKGNAAEAAELYERCRTLSPHDPKMYVQMGVAYQRSGERNKAEIAYARALELDPNDPYAWSNYASLEAAAGFYAEARTKWEKALVLVPGFPPALEGLAKLEAINERVRGPQPPS
jgi:tetratricopeptide (TPR) repeat protein